ncbi:MAG: hypothetical protein LBG92_11105 [Prevotellaceae bacterium]|jgi:hypothetical protein|nr:hypothetical protein [Prevotellaceae bacterium]
MIGLQQIKLCFSAALRENADNKGNPLKKVVKGLKQFEKHCRDVACNVHTEYAPIKNIIALFSIDMQGLIGLGDSVIYEKNVGTMNSIILNNRRSRNLETYRQIRLKTKICIIH